MVTIEDHVGFVFPGGSKIFQLASNPDPLGYSLSVFNPPGFPLEELGR
tara:strand:+ start:268 stop:411 length:144 start_codon:yes stop_codon:yes gene_type:complete